MLDLVKFLSGINKHQYDLAKAGYPLPVAGATGFLVKEKNAISKNNSKSQRVMKLERGHNIVAIGARRIERNRLRSVKAKNRYCNNLAA